MPDELHRGHQVNAGAPDEIPVRRAPEVVKVPAREPCRVAGVPPRESRARFQAQLEEPFGVALRGRGLPERLRDGLSLLPVVVVGDPKGPIGTVGPPKDSPEPSPHKSPPLPS